MWSWNLMDDLEKNRAPFPYYIKLCASFHSHQWIQTGATVWKCSIRVKICEFLSQVTSKFDGWPRKTIGHLFYAASSFVHHFKAMDKFRLELQSANTQFGSKLASFCLVWPWNLTDDLEKTIAHLLYAASSFVHQSFQSHRWIQTGVTVRKRSIWVKISDFCPVWPWNLMVDLEKQ